MPSQISIQLPETLYRRAEQLARKYNQPIADVLDNALTLAENQAAVADEDIQMAQEEIAYRTMHPELMVRHPNQYVAIHQGQLVDYDTSEQALLDRIDERFPDEIVLLKQVQPLVDRILYVRSPRLIRE